MKKFFLALVAVAAIAFVGCNKDDADGLAGTSWAYSGTFYDEDGLNTETYTIRFIDSSSFSYEYSLSYAGRTERDGGQGTFVYNSPNISFYFYGELGWYGTINKKEMTLYFEDGDYFGVFKKQ